MIEPGAEAVSCGISGAAVFLQNGNQSAQGLDVARLLGDKGFLMLQLLLQTVDFGGELL